MEAWFDPLKKMGGGDPIWGGGLGQKKSTKNRSKNHPQYRGVCKKHVFMPFLCPNMSPTALFRRFDDKKPPKIFLRAPKKSAPAAHDGFSQKWPLALAPGPGPRPGPPLGGGGGASNFASNACGYASLDLHHQHTPNHMSIFIRYYSSISVEKKSEKTSGYRPPGVVWRPLGDLWTMFGHVKHA